jgi:hypothetical protein
MYLKYYLKHTTGDRAEKLVKALAMIEDSPLEHVAKITGVPKTIIVKAAKEVGRGKFLQNQKRFDLIATDLYDEMTPEAQPGETREQRIIRINTAVDTYQKSCDHSKYHVRCSKCFKVLGCELNFTHTNETIPFETEIITTQEI